MRKNKSYIIIVVIIALLLIMPAGNSSAAAAALIMKLEEDNVPALQAYQDSGGNWTIGYGSRWNYDAGRWVQGGDTITAEQATRFMNNEIAEKQAMLKKVVTVPLTDNQFTALTSLAYNIGETAFKTSTLLYLLNSGADKNTVADQFDVWRIVRGSVSQGLVNRRAIEKQLFLS